MKVSVVATQFHKWIALVIGIQVVLWILGGLVMSWFPIERVRGEHNIADAPTPVIDPEVALVPPGVILEAAGADVVEVKLRHLLSRPVYEVAVREGRARLYDAQTGALLTPLAEDFARRIALADFKGEAKVLSARLLTEDVIEYRKDLPVWRMILDDEEQTHLYVSPDTGGVVARRNAVWRFYDFFWMLHIMDYKERTDFNNPLIVTFSIIAVILSVSGILLLFYRFSKRDFRWLRRLSSRRESVR